MALNEPSMQIHLDQSPFSTCAHIRLQWKKKMSRAWHLPCRWDFSPIKAHWHGGAGVVLQWGRWHGGLCLICHVPAKLLRFSLFSVADSRCSPDTQQLWLNHTCQTPVFLRNHICFLFFLTTLLNPSFFSSPSLSLSVEDNNIRSWWSASYPDPHQRLPTCQRQQRGSALQTARYAQLQHGINTCPFSK